MFACLEELITKRQKALDLVFAARANARAARFEADQLRNDLRERQAVVMKLRNKLDLANDTIARIRHQLSSSYGKMANYQPVADIRATTDAGRPEIPRRRHRAT